MIKKFKYTLILALFCSNQMHVKAAFFYDFFKDRWLQRALPFYPFNMLAITKNVWDTRKERINIPTNNEDLQKQYPRACAYVENQLKTAGIAPHDIALEESPELFDAKAQWKKATLPLSSIEDQKSESQTKANQAMFITAHEIEHLRLRHEQKKFFLPLAIIAGIEYCSTYVPVMRTRILGTFIKTLCSHALFNACAHYAEYRADSAAIKQFRKNPQILLDAALLWTNVHQQHAKNNITNVITTQEKQIQTNLWYNPIKIASFFWAVDAHASDLARANRFIKAAGLPCNQWLLARMLKNQLFKELTKDPKEQSKDIDTAPIIEALKKLDAVEIPYPFQTYGQ